MAALVERTGNDDNVEAAADMSFTLAECGCLTWDGGRQKQAEHMGAGMFGDVCLIACATYQGK